jgi:ADP-heptose:LPS heptosyltransferase
LARWRDFSPRNDLEDLAALVVNLDLVISVDNSTIHLAGCLGARTWTLLPAAADWRWMAETDESPWYPTMRLLRATREGGWDELLARAAATMRNVAQHSLPMAG